MTNEDSTKPTQGNKPPEADAIVGRGGKPEDASSSPLAGPKKTPPPPLSVPALVAAEEPLPVPLGGAAVLGRPGLPTGAPQANAPQTDTLEAGAWLIGWTHPHDGRPGMVEAGPWPDKTGWSRRYLATSGYAYAALHDLEPRERRASILAPAFQIVAEGVPLPDVLKAFQRTPEFRDVLPPGTVTPGALNPF